MARLLQSFGLLLFLGVLLWAPLAEAAEERQTACQTTPEAGDETEFSQPEKDIYIDGMTNTLYYFEDGKVAAKYAVAVGKSSTPSPLGVFTINHKAANWGTGFGSRFMGLSVRWGKYGIHGTNNPGSIGSMASHGCFRMLNRDVEELYKKVPEGTRVWVDGGPYGPLGWGLRKLTPGDRGSHVVEVQKRLRNLGYYEGEIDGVYGEGMKAGMLRFKKDRGLAYTHEVDAAAYEAMGILMFE